MLMFRIDLSSNWADFAWSRICVDVDLVPRELLMVLLMTSLMMSRNSQKYLSFSPVIGPPNNLLQRWSSSLPVYRELPSSSILQYYNITLLKYYTITLLQYYNITILLYYNIIIF